MKKLVFKLFVIVLIASCQDRVDQNTNPEPKQEFSVEGSWKMIYAEVKESDSTQVKDLSQTDFIKIINKSHFAFFNQNRLTGEDFFAGGGSYSLTGNEYTEKLDFIDSQDYRGHEFSFEVEIKGDTLIHKGMEVIEEAQIERHILERYIRIKSDL